MIPEEELNMKDYKLLFSLSFNLLINFFFY